MSDFKRSFDVECIKSHLNKYKGGVVETLFSHWKVPGEEAGPLGLRVAVREGYLNLYVRGQSVALIKPSRRDGVSVRLHPKYFNQIPKPAKAERKAPGGLSEAAKNSERVKDLSRGSWVEGWISTAATYCDDEKKFVDDLVAANATAIDMEAGIRIVKKNSKRGKVAQRIDLVTVVANGKHPVLNFWEAKCAVNSSLRARSENIDDVSVVKQINGYREWLEESESPVAAAYQETGRVLCELAETFGKPVPKMWAQLTNTRPEVVKNPGLVIGNYTSGLDQGEKDANAAKADSFRDHRKRLVDAGILLVEIERAGDPKAVLPVLSQAPRG